MHISTTENRLLTMIFLTDSSQRVKRILKQPTHTETKSKFSVPKKSQFFKTMRAKRFLVSKLLFYNTRRLTTFKINQGSFLGHFWTWKLTNATSRYKNSKNYIYEENVRFCFSVCCKIGKNFH